MLPVLKRVIRSLVRHMLHRTSMAVVARTALETHCVATGCTGRGLAIPMLGRVIVSKGVAEAIEATLRERLRESATPSRADLPQSSFEDWRCESRLGGASALEHRATVSAGQYASAYRSREAARITVANGRVFWRLETLRMLRVRDPELFRGTVLEVGAGTGVVSSTISRWPEVRVVYSLDYEPETVVNLMPLVQWALEADTSKITRVVGSFNALKLEPGSVDALIAVGALHHSEDLALTMRECFRVLRPGGTLVASEYVLSPSATQAEYEALMRRPLSEEDAVRVDGGTDPSTVRTSLSISEHARPVYLYQAAAFQAGFNVNAVLFDATRDSGGSLARMWRYLRTRYSKSHGVWETEQRRRMGYDGFGNVRAYSLQPRIDFPVHAKGAPGLLALVTRGDRAGRPVYDNALFLFRKPSAGRMTVELQYPSDRVYGIPVVFDEGGRT